MPIPFNPSRDALQTMDVALRMSLATQVDLDALHHLAAAGDSVAFNARMSALAREVEAAVKLARSQDLSAESTLNTNSAGRAAAQVRDGRHEKATAPTKLIQLTKKEYLGDGVYVEIERGMVLLTTDGNRIYLEQQVYDALARYVARLGSPWSGA